MALPHLSSAYTPAVMANLLDSALLMLGCPKTALPDWSCLLGAQHAIMMVRGGAMQLDKCSPCVYHVRKLTQRAYEALSMLITIGVPIRDSSFAIAVPCRDYTISEHRQ